MYYYNDLSGKKFGRLTVITKTEKRRHRSVIWECKCDCGNITEVASDDLVSGNTRSCGCLQKEITSRHFTKHGLRKYGNLYNVWNGMIQRCENPANKSYPSYGGRGISVCEEWRNDISAFFKWAKESGYGMGLSLDRIDNNKGYSPNNCRWTTVARQNLNKRNNRFVTYAGKTQTLKEWADSVGMKDVTLNSRIRAGWDIERALTEPVHNT